MTTCRLRQVVSLPGKFLYRKTNPWYDTKNAPLIEREGFLMKLLQKEGKTEKNVPMLLLLAVGIIEFLFMTLESRFFGMGYYLAETYVIVPCLLFLGYILREKLSPFAGRRLVLAAAAVGWFVFVQCIHRLLGMGNHPMTTVFFVYLMGFPFAALSDDRDNRGLWWIGGVLTAVSLVLAGYSACLVLGRVPESLRDVLYWDGSRLYALWHPNISACYFMIGIGFSAAFLEQARKPWVKALLLAAMVLQFLAMALTNCRTIQLMTGALLGGIVFFRTFRGSWKQLLLGLLAAALILAGSFKLSGMIFRWNNDHLVANLQAVQEETLPAAETAQTEMEADTESAELNDEGIIVSENWQGSLAGDMRTLNGRTDIWKSALKAIRDDKKLALWGTEYSGTVISVYNHFPVEHSHNSWMEVLMYTGIPGLLMALVFSAISVVSAGKLLLHPETELWKRVIAMMTMCVMVAGFLEPYLFATNLCYHAIDFTFFFCTGYLDYWCRPGQQTE